MPWGAMSGILPEVEALIRTSGADLRIGSERAYYDAGGDFIRVPPPQAFFEPINRHETVLHELGHWSGATHRLGRDLSGGFGSKSYCERRTGRRNDGSLHLRRARHRPDGAPRRLHRRMAQGPARGQPRHRAGGERGIEGVRLSADIPTGHRDAIHRGGHYGQRRVSSFGRELSGPGAPRLSGPEASFGVSPANTDTPTRLLCLG